MLENCFATKRSFTKHTLIGVLIAAGILGGQTVSAEGQTRSASARAQARVDGSQSRFDGPWSVVIMTDSGECDRAYRFGLQIDRGRVLYEGGGVGHVSNNGSVSVTVRQGDGVAVGSGRLSGSSGSGRWRGTSSVGRCAGHWQASRH